MSLHNFPAHRRPPWLNPTSSDSHRSSSYLEQALTRSPESLCNHPPALPHFNSTLFASFDTTSNNLPNAYLIAQRSTPVPYEPRYRPPAQQQQTQVPYLTYPLYQQLSEARYLSGSDQTHSGSYNRALPSSSSVDGSLPPPLDVPRGGMWQGPPYYPSYTDFQIPPTSSDLRSPHSVYPPASSFPQYQSPASPAYLTDHSHSRGAVPIVAATNAQYQQPMEMSHVSLDRTIRSSQGTTQLPYPRVPTAPSTYDLSPKTSEGTIKKKPTKKRKRIYPRQLAVLNRTYACTSLPSTKERAQLARDLDMSPRRVQIWFQNQRQLSRRGERKPTEPPIGQGVTLPPDAPPVGVHPWDGPGPVAPMGELSYFPQAAMMRSGQTSLPPSGRPRADIDPRWHWSGFSRGY